LPCTRTAVRWRPKKLFRRAIDISRAGQSEEAVSPILLTNYARTLRALGRWNEAARTAERAYFKAKQADDRTVFKQAMLLRATIYIDQHDFARATAMLAEADAMYRRDLPPGHSAFTVLTSRE
jgi:tetratricopeptide (TPR) repeat protein